MYHLSGKLLNCLFNTKWKSKLKLLLVRNIQVSIVGAGGDIGANLSLLLKQNLKLKRLHLYDDSETVLATAMELNHIPGGPTVTGYYGENFLSAAIQASDLILMTQGYPRKPGNSREQMISANAPGLHRLCRAMADENPTAFLAITTSPLNSMVPFASSLLFKYGAFNPYKILGVTHIDTARTRAYTANALLVTPRKFWIPVIGGHSDETIIPLFSNITPQEYKIDDCQADTLTGLIRRAGTEVVFQKQGTDSAVLAVAWSINEFCDLLIDAILGSEVVVNCLTTNSQFGTKFFSGPTKVGPYGIIHTCQDFLLNDYEQYLLGAAVPLINRDVTLGEDYIGFLNSPRKPKR